MKKLVKRVSLPLMLLVGLTLLGPQTAEAGRWRRHVRRAHVPVVGVHVGSAVHVHAPRVGVHVGPRVRVHAPAVGVHVGPAVRVYAPGVGVHVGPRYPAYHHGSYYLRW